jgi:hypothetical protein
MRQAQSLRGVEFAGTEPGDPMTASGAPGSVLAGSATVVNDSRRSPTPYIPTSTRAVASAFTVTCFFEVLPPAPVKVSV